MKILFYLAITGLILFEIANVYFIMPMPGSQQMNSIDLAYFLHSWRWTIRIFFYFLVLISFYKSFQSSKWLSIAGLILVAATSYLFNFNMSADQMFQQPQELVFKNAAENTVDDGRMVLAFSYQGEARAYPISFIGYHHQVRDTVAGHHLMVTYCTVCRTGRIYEPVIDAKPVEFRLVGMDRYNAMFEDALTKSWWRQETGIAVAGPLKGRLLPEVPSYQLSLKTWLKMHPNSLIMQEDSRSLPKYDSLARFEAGLSKGDLTRRDTQSWKDKSWIIGVEYGQQAIAIDWNELVKLKSITFVIDYKLLTVVLASDQKSFFVFESPSPDPKLIIANDTLYSINGYYNLKGENISGRDTVSNLKPVQAYQEYWHSWKTFHPNTKIHKL